MNKVQAKELKKLFDPKRTFLFDGKVYEVTPNHVPKYRFIIAEDDYDYVVDKKLKRILDLKVKELGIN